MRIVAFTLAVLLSCFAASAQTKVYLITIGPGAESYEKFGHNMLWVHDPAHHYDPAYNWGIFSFDEGFVGRFIQGRLEYWMDAWDATKVLDEYKRADRSIWIQELNLSEAQAQLLLTRCELNRQPQYSHYKYDYYRDNCSTRVRDMLDSVIGGQIKAQLQNVPTDTTYRWHTRRLTQDDWWLYVGLDYIMGHPIDHPISAWEECFLPVRMMERLKSMKIKDESGREVPLVLGEEKLYQSKTEIDREHPPRYAIWIFAGVGIVLGGIMAALALGKRRWTRVAFAVVVVAWALLSGLAGSFCTYAWFFTDHVVARYNENWLQLNPVAIVLVVLVPAMLLGKQWGARHFALAAAVLSAVGLIAKILPSMYQVNGEIIALALPANIGMALAVRMVWRGGNEMMVIRRGAGRSAGNMPR